MAIHTSSDDLLRLMEERRSCRAFKEDAIPEEYVQMILEAGRWAPSGSNMQPWDILIVQDSARRAWLVSTLEKMVRIDWENETAAGGTFPFGGLGYTRSVPLFFLIITDPRFSKISGQKSTSISIIQRQNVGHLVQNMWLMTHSLGLASVITMIRHVDAEIKEYFGVPTELELTQVLPVGYPKQFRAKSRRPLESFIHRDRFDRSKLRSNETIRELISNPRKLALEIYGT